MDCRWIYGDALAEMAKLPSRSIDAIITDPPYNIGTYSTGDIAAPWRKTLNNSIAEWDQGDFSVARLVEPFTRLLKATGTIFAFTSYSLIGDWHTHFDPLFETLQMCVWHKTNPPIKVRRAGFLNACEYIIVLWNKKHTWNFGKQAEMHNFFEGPRCMGNERLDHPTQKPLWLLRRLVNLCTNPGDTVLDPYAGVASTGEACLRNERHFIGIENDQRFYRLGEKRLAQWNMDSLFEPGKDDTHVVRV